MKSTANALLLSMFLGILLHEGCGRMMNIGINIPITSCSAAEAHNALRRQHYYTKDLNGDEELVKEAGACALHILNTNQSCDVGTYVAQNVMILPMQAQKEDIDNVVKDWYAPINKIRLNDSLSYKEFPIHEIESAARIIWTTTTKVGCGAAISVGRSARTVYVCLYTPGAKWTGFEDMDFVDYIKLKMPKVQSPEKEFNGHCKDEFPGKCDRYFANRPVEFIKQACQSVGFIERSCKRSCNACGTDKKD